MASIEFDEASGRYRIWFRYAGKPYKRSLKTTEKREAEAVVGRVEETIRLLERGRLDIPSDADPGVFILSDGKLNWKLTAEQEYTLEKLLDLYPKSLPEGAKAQTTRKTEETHISHLSRHLKTSRLAQTVSTADMQAYIDRRLHNKYRERPTGPVTVKKEVATLRLIWNWAVGRVI